MDAFYLFVGIGFFVACVVIVQRAFGRVQP